MRQVPLPLEYEHGHKSHEGPLGWIGRLLVVVGIYPLLFLIMLHVLWGLEYAAAGHAPGPQHHGPGNPRMEVVYAAVFYLFLGIAVALPAAAVLGAVLFTRGTRRGGRLARLTAVVWVVSLVVSLLDPVGAWDFYFD